MGVGTKDFGGEELSGEQLDKEQGSGKELGRKLRRKRGVRFLKRHACGRAKEGRITDRQLRVLEALRSRAECKKRDAALAAGGTSTKQSSPHENWKLPNSSKDTLQGFGYQKTQLFQKEEGKTVTPRTLFRRIIPFRSWCSGKYLVLS